MTDLEKDLIKQKFKTMDALMGHVWELSRFGEDGDAPMMSDRNAQMQLRELLQDLYSAHINVSCHVSRTCL